MKYVIFILTFIYVFQLNIHSQETLHINFEETVVRAINLSKEDPDSAISILDDMKRIQAERGDTTMLIQCLLGMSSIQADRLNHGDAYDHAGEALFLAEEFEDTLLMTEAYSLFGKLNYVFNQKEAARTYLLNACELSKSLLSEGRIKAENMLNAYFNLALYNRWYNQYDLAISYLDSCYAISDTIIHDAVDRAYLDAEKGQIFLKMGKADEAINVLIPVSLIFEDLESSTLDATEDKAFLILLYSMLGDAYRELKEVDLAMFFYEKSIKAGELYKMHLGQKPYVLERYAWMLFERGWYVEAYANLKEAKRLNDRYFGALSFQNSDFITVKNRYREELLKKSKALNQNKMALVKVEKSVLRLKRILIMSLLLLVFTLILLFRIYKKTKRSEKSNEIQQKQTLSKAQLARKNKHLYDYTLRLIEREEIIVNLSSQLEKGGTTSEKKAVLKSVKQSSKGLWQDFNSRFMEVNLGFYERLLGSVPGLSAADQKICALIKLNFSGKEMAFILGISVGSVHMARHRLRKKMKMERDESLSEFIDSV